MVDATARMIRYNKRTECSETAYQVKLTTAAMLMRYAYHSMSMTNKTCLDKLPNSFQFSLQWQFLCLDDVAVLPHGGGRLTTWGGARWFLQPFARFSTYSTFDYFDFDGSDPAPNKSFRRFWQLRAKKKICRLRLLRLWLRLRTPE